MTGRKVYMCALVTALAGVCLALPLSSSGGVVLAHRGANGGTAWAQMLGRPTEGGGWGQGALGGRVARQDRLGSLTEEQREFMSKYILQTLTEMLNREGCHEENPISISDRDYQGWMDFGRRSTEELGLDS
ncbi:cholecystokinin [Amia ocellicauda]|uniref:cholecystokinin n=1 Tax=Amia ocellicauda TaxID=2972642 RepID=UPI0034645C5E